MWLMREVFRMDSHPTVGVIGVGVIGGAVASTLLEAGYPVVVHDVDEARMERMESAGAGSAGTPADLADEVDVVVSSLPNGDQVRAVALDRGGLVEADGADFVYVDISTIGPEAIREVADGLGRRGVTVVDAPISGGQEGAESGELRFMIGCDGPLPEACERVFDTLGVQAVQVGGVGDGQVVKLCNNMMSAAAMISLSEALVLAEKADVSRQKLVEALAGATGDSWVLENRASVLIDHEFEPGFRGSLMAKDLGLVNDAANDLGVELLMGSTSLQLFKALEGIGMGDRNVSAIVALVERLSGVGSRDAD